MTTGTRSLHRVSAEREAGPWLGRERAVVWIAAVLLCAAFWAGVGIAVARLI